MRSKIERWPSGYAEEWAAGYTEGLVEARTSTILRLLEMRGIPVPEDARERITSCTDLDTLAVWTDRSPRVTTVEDLFSAGGELDHA